ncbi:MAG: PAS domain-containing protein, partial [Burkholderiaceae bacterium]
MTAQLPGSASPRVPPATGRGALSSQRRLLRLLTAGAIALLLFSSFGFVVYEREQHLSSATELASRRAAGLADDLAQTLRVARVAIEQLESRVDRLPDGVPVGNALETGYGEWDRLLAALPLPFELHARDAAGTDFAGGERASLPGNPGAGRPLAAAADPAGWVVGDSARRGEPPERRLPIWRPARANTHGIAAYSVELSQAALVERFEAARDRQRGGVALFRVEPDGSGLTLLARAPALDADLGKRFHGPLHVALKSASRGTFRDVTGIDGLERIVGFQRLDGDARDLVLGYGIETRAVLSAWRASMPIAATTTLMLLGLLLLGGQRMDRSLRDADAAVRALHSSQAQYRALAENLPDVLVRLDREGRRLYANPAIELATGSRADALIGKKIGDLKLPDDDVADWMATLERAIVTQRVQHKEFTLTGPNGARQWESTIVPEPAIRAGAETVLVITRDVTARREFEDALRRSELRFRLASSFGQVWDWDL